MDDTARNAARRWRDTQDPTDWVVAVRHSTRSGILNRVDLALLALLGHGPARHLVEEFRYDTVDILDATAKLRWWCAAAKLPIELRVPFVERVLEAAGYSDPLPPRVRRLMMSLTLATNAVGVQMDPEGGWDQFQALLVKVEQGPASKQAGQTVLDYEALCEIGRDFFLERVESQLP